MKFPKDIYICQRIDSIGEVVSEGYKEDSLQPLKSNEVLSTKPNLKPTYNHLSYAFL